MLQLISYLPDIRKEKMDINEIKKKSIYFNITLDSKGKKVFKLLKKKKSSEDVLAFLNFNKPFLLTTYTSKQMVLSCYKAFTMDKDQFLPYLKLYRALRKIMQQMNKG